MTQLMTMGVLAGTGLGAGLWLVLARLPFMRRTRFVDRIAPQLKSVDVQSRLLAAGPVNVTPFGPLERIIRPVLLDAVSWLGRFNLGTTVLSKRLAQAGRRQRPRHRLARPTLLVTVRGLGYKLEV